MLRELFLAVRGFSSCSLEKTTHRNPSAARTTVKPHACACRAQELLRAEIALQNDLAAEGFSQPSLKNFKGAAAARYAYTPPPPLIPHHTHPK